MKVLITGGAGYVGYSLVRQILQSYNNVSEIVVYDNLSRKNYAFFTHDRFVEKPVRFVQGDILDGRTLLKTMKGVDVVYHLAAKATTPFADHESHFFDQINHWGSAQVASAVEESNIQHLIYLSSAAVYGTSDDIFSEASAATPQSFYGISKLAGEEQIFRLRQKCKVHILRAGNIYGYNPAMRIDAVINRFMFEANFLHRISVHGTGEQVRPFIHVEKVAFVLKELLLRPLDSGIYNVVEYNFSVNELVAYVREIYPDVETLSVNFNFKMRNIQIQTPCSLFHHFPPPQKTLLDELHEFKVKFSF